MVLPETKRKGVGVVETKERTLRSIIISYLMIAIGAVVAAFALEALLVPCTILDGGVTGISIIFKSVNRYFFKCFCFCFEHSFPHYRL